MKKIHGVVDDLSQKLRCFVQMDKYVQLEIFHSSLLMMMLKIQTINGKIKKKTIQDFLFAIFRLSATWRDSTSATEDGKLGCDIFLPRNSCGKRAQQRKARCLAAFCRTYSCTFTWYPLLQAHQKSQVPGFSVQFN